MISTFLAALLIRFASGFPVAVHHWEAAEATHRSSATEWSVEILYKEYGKSGFMD